MALTLALTVAACGAQTTRTGHGAALAPVTSLAALRIPHTGPPSECNVWLERGSGLIVFQGDGQPVAPNCRAWIHTAARHGAVWSTRTPSFAAQIRYSADTASCRLRNRGGSRYATVFDPPSGRSHAGADACRTLLTGGWVRQPAGALTSAVGPKPQPSPPAAKDTPRLTVAHWTGREPSALYFSADAGNVVTDLHWTVWDRTLALGEGESIIQSCVPSCARGADMPVRAYIVLSAPRHGASRT